ncbi:hypothetical protein GPECTOR_84g318 [Gonium pectorale]|uniref:Uncharacterized protein n=1 Tax=Gonium pectorale TaxID=33097 RepID=A0A150G195_GONPE|nr:hypothetical protein GPECTOR_84g318 [Gonium pectorale]|eukprot:KXZ43642.1 hypothetical protein GPECTOR_84g318 [Gonium pectorale]
MRKWQPCGDNDPESYGNLHGMHGRYRTNLTVSVEHAEEYYIRDPHDGSKETLAATSPLSAKGLFLQLTPAYSATYDCAGAGAGGTGGTAGGGTSGTGGGTTGELLLRYQLHVTSQSAAARPSTARRSNVSEDLPVDGTVYKEPPPPAAAAANTTGASVGKPRPGRRRSHQRRRELEVVGNPAPYMLNSQTDVHDQHDGSGGSHTYTVQRSFLVPTDLAHEAMEESGTADIAAGEFLDIF